MINVCILEQDHYRKQVASEKLAHKARRACHGERESNFLTVFRSSDSLAFHDHGGLDYSPHSDRAALVETNFDQYCNGLANKPTTVAFGKAKHHNHCFFPAGPTSPTNLCMPSWYEPMFTISDMHLTTSTCWHVPDPLVFLVNDDKLEWPGDEARQHHNDISYTMYYTHKCIE